MSKTDKVPSGRSRPRIIAPREKVSSAASYDAACTDYYNTYGEWPGPKDIDFSEYFDPSESGCE